MLRSLINLIPRPRASFLPIRGRPITSQEDLKKITNNPPSPPKGSLNDLD